jgi:hypothetical protein
LSGDRRVVAPVEAVEAGRVEEPEIRAVHDHATGQTNERGMESGCGREIEFTGDEDQPGKSSGARTVRSAMADPFRGGSAEVRSKPVVRDNRRIPTVHPFRREHKFMP